MLDKAILHNKEYRKPYRGSKNIDRTCRNHGTCIWCEFNRKYKNIKRKQSAIEKLIEYSNSTEI